MSLNRRLALPEEVTEPTEEDEAEDDDVVDEATGTAEDLVSEADPGMFDQTWLVTKSNLPLATGVDIPVPRPWQGIPRMAFVFNFSMVYDEDNDEWVRQKKGPRFSTAGSGQLTVGSKSGASRGTGLSEPDLAGDALIPWISLAQGAPGGDIPFMWRENDADIPNAMNVWLRWGSSAGEYEIVFHNDSAVDLDIGWAVIRVTP